MDVEGYQINNRVYSRGGCSIAVHAATVGIKVIRKYDKANHCDMRSE